MMAHRRPKKRNPKARFAEKDGKVICHECGKELAETSLRRHMKLHDIDEHKPKKARRILRRKNDR